MRDLHAALVDLADANPAASKVLDLLKELGKIGSAFVIDECLRDQSHFEACLAHPDAQVDVFSQSVEFESSGSLKHFATDAHIKASRLKVACPVFVSSNPAGSQYRRHRISHGPLQVGKLLVTLVRTSPGVKSVLRQCLFNFDKILRRQDTIRIKNTEERSFRFFKSEIAARPRP